MLCTILTLYSCNYKIFYLSHLSFAYYIAGYAAAKQTLFASVFPVDPKQLDEMFAAVDRLLLNDSSISITRDQSPLLGK